MLPSCHYTICNTWLVRSFSKAGRLYKFFLRTWLGELAYDFCLCDTTQSFIWLHPNCKEFWDWSLPVSPGRGKNWWSRRHIPIFGSLYTEQVSGLADLAAQWSHQGPGIFLSVLPSSECQLCPPGGCNSNHHMQTWLCARMEKALRSTLGVREAGQRTSFDDQSCQCSD